MTNDADPIDLTKLQERLVLMEKRSEVHGQMMAIMISQLSALRKFIRACEESSDPAVTNAARAAGLKFNALADQLAALNRDHGRRST